MSKSTQLDSNTPHGAAPVGLRDFDDAYGRVEPADNNEVPDGKYHVRIQEATLDHSQKGNPMVTFDMVVLSGPHADRHIFKNVVITHASLEFVKRDLQALGLDMSRLSELPEYLKDLEDVVLKITKRTKGKYANVHFNKRIQRPTNDRENAEESPF